MVCYNQFMKVVFGEENKYVLRFDRGEEVMDGLRKFCESENITAGSFSGLGAASEVVISWYNTNRRAYSDRKFSEIMEIASLAGNVAKFQDQIVIHAHGSFSDYEFQTFSGHVKKLVVSATCEITLEQLPGVLNREPDEATGLNLLQ